jgi:hypothetical protein
MSTMSCDELHEIACELALDLLTGVERASALAHLEECQACRAEVVSLAATADELLVLAPAVEPPAHFSDDVLHQLDELATPHRVQPRRRRVSRRVVAFAAAAAIAIAVVVGSVVVGGNTTPSTETAAIRSGAGVVVGRVSVSGTDPATIALDMHGWTDMLEAYGAAGATRAELAVTGRDGTQHVIGIPVDRRATWTATYAVPGVDGASSVASIAVRGSDGALWCSATFA